MLLRLIKLQWLLALALLIPAAPGRAQGVKPERQPQVQGQGRQGQQGVVSPAQEGQRGFREVKGKILQEKEIAISGTDIPNLIVLIELQDGQRIAVDLGPRTALKQADIKTGAEATVHGGLIRVSGTPVFLASDIDLGGHNWKITRPLMAQLGEAGQGQAGQEQAGEEQAEQEQTYQISGTIQNEQNVDVRSGGQNKVVLVQTDKGEQVMVDLGPVTKLQNVTIKKGDKISVTGHSGQAGEASILFADQVQSGGKTVRVEWPNFEEGGQGGMQPQGGQSQVPQQRQPSTLPAPAQR